MGMGYGSGVSRRVGVDEARFSKKRDPSVISVDRISRFAVWLGTDTSVLEYKKKIGDRDVIGDAGEMLENLQFEDVPQRLDLMVVTPRMMGFRSGASHKEVLAALPELGISLCPQVTAPQLRIEYRDQPFGEVLVVMSEPIMCGLSAAPHIFRVERCVAGLWLSSTFAYLHHHWDADTQMIFPVRKPSES